MSEAFALSHYFMIEKMNPPMVVRTPIGHCHTSKIVPRTIVEIKGIEFLASPIILKTSTIDLILGMDWLKVHDAALYCGTKSVQLFHPVRAKLFPEQAKASKPKSTVAKPGQTYAQLGTKKLSE